MELSEQNLQDWKKACKISAAALQYGKSLVKKGALVVDVCDRVDEKIRQLGARPSFPAQISLDNVAAHYCGEKDDPLLLDGIVKLDVGAHIDGFAGDNALTVDLTGEHKRLVDASRDALEAAIRIIRPEIKLHEVGAVVEKTILGYGLKPVRNLSGHGIGHYEIHTAPTVPNYENDDQTTLKDGQIIAIEPFATNGAGRIYESGNAGVFSLVQKRPVRDQFLREILAEIEKNYGTLPFAKRWLTKTYSPLRVSLALNQLVSQRIIMQYPPLVERGKGLVSQAEHTVLVREKAVVLTKTD